MNTPASDNYLDVLNSIQSMSLSDDKSSNVTTKTENIFWELSVSRDCHLASSKIQTSKTALNESYTITKDHHMEKNLSVINEENSEYDCGWNKVHHTSFTGSTNLSKFKDGFFSDQDVKLISVTSENHEVKDEDERYYDSDESLGILPDLMYDCDVNWDNLIADSNCKRDLNTTMNLSNKPMEKSNCQNHEFKYSEEELMISPICNKLNISCAQTDKSLVRCNESTPKYASTPKQENNNSYVIDKGIASMQNIASNFLLNKKISENCYGDENDLEIMLNKTTVIETDVDFMRTNILDSAYSESSKSMNQQQNILNVTCNIAKPFDTGNLNKTFESLNVLVDKCILPTIIPDQCEEAEFYSDLCKENVLNLTCDLVKEIDNNFPQTELACMTFSDNPNGNATSFLNTTISYPHEFVKTEQICNLNENKPDVRTDEYGGKKDILNVTYENIDKSYRLDTSSETLKCITNLEESNKPSQLGIKNSSTKKVLSFPTKDIVLKKSKIKKSTAFDREKNVRRSISCFGKTNVTRAEPSRWNRRNSFTCNTNTLSQVNETKVLSHSSAKDLFPTCSVKDSESKCSFTIKDRLAGMNSCDLENQAIKSLLTKSSGTKLEKTKSVSKIKLKGSQESPLNETINLPPPISDASKTVIKKPRNAMKINYSGKSSLDPHEVPLGKSIKSAIPSFQKSTSVRISTTRHKEITQKFDENRTSASSSATGLKKPFIVEDRLKISRLPQRTLSQKKICSDFQSSNTQSSSNITRPQSSISVLKLPSTRKRSLPLAASNSLNQRNELSGKITLNDKLLSAQQSSREQSTRIPKHFSSSSKIPSISQISRQPGKSSQGISRRTESSTHSTYQSDLR